MATAVLSALASAATAAIPAARQAELLYLLRQDCGSCHGMRLSGGLGPALLPERLRHWDSRLLATTILQGRPGTPMPPWQPFLTHEEALWLADQLKRGIRP
ncbi:MAG TPA: cytochrome c [Sedimenticola sp.]|nr:cytochrome c [Sedimenticola sp.]